MEDRKTEILIDEEIIKEFDNIGVRKNEAGVDLVDRETFILIQEELDRHGSIKASDLALFYERNKKEDDVL